ncbi:MAG: hypothetical protein PHE17_06945 [Thiothrix sp.]|uniref:hypothetical protein n=1 Tax=Thiothrix sp. TaxID=1032 RepID=UPI00262213DE|nr:hypothetical protein [Thiothrix sp.]MDD5392739.1 hypothetical protein [Thiothrix sp.]
MIQHKPLVQYLQTRLDSLAIIAALASVARTDAFAALDDTDRMVLAALKRANPFLQDTPLSGIQDYLYSMNEAQQLGLISNVKGILHEMEFVRIENTDGDSVHASFFADTNHPDTDIQLVDDDSGETWEVQLKATDSSFYVQDWLDTHPDGQIAITSELADKMELESTGIANEDLTTDVESFVDKLLEADATDTLWDYVPTFSVMSLSIVIWKLWQRYQRGDISYERFKWLAAWAAGKKAVKITILGALLSLPVVGALTGAALVVSFIVGLAKHSQ